MPKQLTQDEVIAKFVTAHGDKYDYTEVVYKNCTTKVKVNCNICNHTWSTIPYTLWNGHGCPRCAKSERYNTESYVAKAKEVHNGFYTYESVNYADAGSTITVTCPKHGNFETTASAHIGKRKQGCSKCANEANALRSAYSTEEFVSRAQAKFPDGRYDYSKVVYKKSGEKVEVNCLQHGPFWVEPKSHLSGSGCSDCWAARRGLVNRLSQADFIDRAEVVHSFKYDYSLLDFSKHTTGINSTVEIICPTHGKFSQTLVDHLHQGAGCPECASYGFKGNLSGKLYILTCGEITKIGITNLKVTKRVRDISRSAEKNFKELISFHFQDGYVASGVETNVLKLLRSSYEGVKESFDGSSECFLNVDIKQLMQDIVSTAYLKLNPHLI